MCLELIYLIYMNTIDLALNKLQWLIWNQTKLNQTNQLFKMIVSFFFPSHAEENIIDSLYYEMFSF